MSASTPPRFGLIVAIAALASAVAFLDGTIVNVALPSIQHDLHASAAALEWVVAGYGLANAALLVTGGHVPAARAARAP